MLAVAATVLVGTSIVLGGLLVARPQPKEAGQKMRVEQGPTITLPKLPVALPVTPSTQINTSNWKVYRNKEYGFEIQYPQYFTIRTVADTIQFYDPTDRQEKEGPFFRGPEGLLALSILVPVSDSKMAEDFKVFAREYHRLPDNVIIGTNTFTKVFTLGEDEDVSIYYWKLPHIVLRIMIPGYSVYDIAITMLRTLHKITY